MTHIDQMNKRVQNQVVYIIIEPEKELLDFCLNLMVDNY